MKTIDSKNSFLSYSNTAFLRVLFEFMVLIHHLYTPYTSLGMKVFSAFGPIAVGGFIFLSGYGVGFNFLHKKDEYTEKLLKKRLPRTYGILLIVNLCYLALYLAIGGKFDNIFSAIISVLYLPVFEGFVALSHWIYFLADLIVYYLLFLLFSWIFKKSKNSLLLTSIAILAVDLVIIAVLSVINYKTGSVRYLRACLSFPLGLICAAFSEKLVAIVKSKKALIFLGMSAISIIIVAYFNYDPIVEYVLPIFAALALVVMIIGVNTESKVVSYLSGLVIYVYVSHEFFLILCRTWFSSTFHANIIGLITFACSMTFAILLNFILRKIKK